jgi:hypothetical protein
MRQRGINVSSFAHRKEPEADSRCRQMAGLCLKPSNRSLHRPIGAL